MKHKWIEEKIMAKEKTFYQWLYLKLYNRKAPPVPVGYRILQTGFKYDNNAPENKYNIKYDQNFIFESVA